MKIAKLTGSVFTAALLLSGVCLAQTDLAETHGATGKDDHFLVFMFVIALASFFTYGYRERQKHKTIALMIEKGLPIPEDLLRTKTGLERMLSAGKSPQNTPDNSLLLKGLVLSMLGIGLIIYLAVLKDANWAGGFIPLGIGLAFLLYWKTQKTDDRKPRP